MLRALSLYALILCALGETVPAQSGGSPHIAPFLASPILRDRSPLFNWPDGLWNLGEGVGVPTSDVGG